MPGSFSPPAALAGDGPHPGLSPRGHPARHPSPNLGEGPRYGRERMPQLSPLTVIFSGSGDALPVRVGGLRGRRLSSRGFQPLGNPRAGRRRSHPHPRLAPLATPRPIRGEGASAATSAAADCAGEWRCGGIPARAGGYYALPGYSVPFMGISTHRHPPPAWRSRHAHRNHARGAIWRTTGVHRGAGRAWRGRVHPNASRQTGSPSRSAPVGRKPTRA